MVAHARADEPGTLCALLAEISWKRCGASQVRGAIGTVCGAAVAVAVGGAVAAAASRCDAMDAVLCYAMLMLQ